MKRSHASQNLSLLVAITGTSPAHRGFAGGLICVLLVLLKGVLLMGVLACEGRESPPEPAASFDAQPQTRDAPLEPGQARKATHAGSWYPGEARTLRHEIETRLEAQETARDAKPIIAMIGPHAGLRFSGSVAAAGYAALAHQRVSRVFLLGPSHYARFSGIALPAPDIGSYATPLGEIAIDREAIETLRGEPGYHGPPTAHGPEHSLEMHAIFLAAVHPEAQLVPLVVGNIDDAAEVRSLASRLRPLLRSGDVLIASSDFTHYGPNYRYMPFRDGVPQRLDELLRAALVPLFSRDLEGFDSHLHNTGDTICGGQPLRLLLALLPPDATARKLAADTSGRITGDFSNSVSYLTMVYRGNDGWPHASRRSRSSHFEQGPEVLGPEEREIALQIARTTLEHYLERGHIPDAGELGVPNAGPMRETYAAFVTLKKEGALRGCIGHILPVTQLWRSIRDNAIAAAVKDTRFSPVTAYELDDLELEISVLTRPSSVDSPDGFEVGRHGVVLRAHGRRAVFLPQVAPEQGWNRATTLSQLSRKAGLAVDTWRTPAAELSVFEAQVFSEISAEVLKTREHESPRRDSQTGRL
jgi:AmmeMemoRadiSam system protein B/AmmeMemoRadiSam system protein A